MNQTAKAGAVPSVLGEFGAGRSAVPKRLTYFELLHLHGSIRIPVEIFGAPLDPFRSDGTSKLKRIQNQPQDAATGEDGFATNITTGRYSPVFIDGAGLAEDGVSASFAVLGELGSGKGFYLKTLKNRHVPGSCTVDVPLTVSGAQLMWGTE